MQLSVDKRALAGFCRRNHIRKLSFFGSVLRADFGEGSDVDVLVEFEPGHTPGLALIRMQDELSSLLAGRRVDLVTPGFLSPYFRQEVMDSAEVAFDAAA